MFTIPSRYLCNKIHIVAITVSHAVLPDVGVSQDLVRVEEKNNVTLMWTVEQYKPGHPVYIKDSRQHLLMEFIFARHTALSNHTLPAGDGQRYFGISLVNVSTSMAGVYSLSYNDVTKNLSLFVFGQYILVK